MYSALSESPFNVRRMHENLLAQIRFLDEGLRPQRAEQLILRHDARPMPDQQRQQVERLGGQRLRNAVAEQGALGGIQQERTELECRHTPPSAANYNSTQRVIEGSLSRC